MPLFICRWPNGDFSAVNATTKSDAIWMLDEEGDATEKMLTRCSDFMVHFTLPKKATADDCSGRIPDVSLESFGEATYDFISSKVYTCYAAAEYALDGEPEGPSEEETNVDQAVILLNQALDEERARYAADGSLNPKPKVTK